MAAQRGCRLAHIAASARRAEAAQNLLRQYDETIREIANFLCPPPDLSRMSTRELAQYRRSLGLRDSVCNGRR